MSCSSCVGLDCTTNIIVGGDTMIQNCNNCQPPPFAKCGCSGCDEYRHLCLKEPPTLINPARNTEDRVIWDMSGGMALTNTHWRPTVQIPYGNFGERWMNYADPSTTGYARV